MQKYIQENKDNDTLGIEQNISEQRRDKLMTVRENKQKREWDFNVETDYSAVIYHIKEL